jgi:hypothetical protein
LSSNLLLFGTGFPVAALSASSIVQQHSNPLPVIGRERHASFGRRVHGGDPAMKAIAQLSLACTAAAELGAACRAPATQKFAILANIAHLSLPLVAAAGGRKRRA